MQFSFATVMPIVLLVASNLFMTVAWYGHLNSPISLFGWRSW